MKSNQDWIDWGKRDPLFGVATFDDSNKRGGENEWTDSAIYGMGEADWNQCYQRWSSYGVQNGRCLEIGCGVGRYTMHIAKTFERVDALDVSPEMIEYARERIHSENVTFWVTDGATLPVDDQSVDTAFSAFVFQHFDSYKDTLRYFRELARVLVEDGTLMIHLPLHQFPIFSQRLNTVLRAQYEIVKAIGTLRAQIDRIRLRSGSRPPRFRLLSFELNDIFRDVESFGFTDLEVAIFELPSRREQLHFLFARKASLNSEPSASEGVQI